MNSKQFVKLCIAFVGAYSIAHTLIYFFGERTGNLLNELPSVLPYIIAAICAGSLVMFTYVDNSAKDLTDLRNDVDRSKYVLVHARMSDLKREILSNVGVIFLFFILERIAKAIIGYLISEQVFPNQWLVSVIGVSLGFACFVVIAISSVCQLAGFIIAVEFREVIANNRK